jgi:hypothetical protein
MEQSGVVGLNIEGSPERVIDFRDAPFCSQQVLVDMLGTELITPDVVRGWVESSTVATIKIGRRRVINLHRIRRDLDLGKPCSAPGTTPMSKTLYIVEACTLHGATKQRRWHRVHTGPNKAECCTYIERVIAELPSGLIVTLASPKSVPVTSTVYVV